MLAGVNDVLVITTPKDQSSFMKLLGDGSSVGIKISYKIQPSPDGLAQGLLLGKEFLDGENFWFILGDNIFHGVGLGTQLKELEPSSGAHIFTYEVADPGQYGVLGMDAKGLPLFIEEKPRASQSRLAITGLYFFDEKACSIAESISKSPRGEMEITSVLQSYLEENNLRVTHLSRGTAWLDTGTIESMTDASTYIRVIEERSGLKIGCIEEIALRNGWISAAELNQLCVEKPASKYWDYLRNLNQIS